MLGLSTKPICPLARRDAAWLPQRWVQHARRSPTFQRHPIRKGSCQRGDSTAKKLFPLLNFLPGFGVRIRQRRLSTNGRAVIGSATATRRIPSLRSAVRPNPSPGRATATVRWSFALGVSVRRCVTCPPHALSLPISDGAIHLGVDDLARSHRQSPQPPAAGRSHRRAKL